MISSARKVAELTAYVDSIDRELGVWRDAADGERAPLRRHFTQIEAIAGTLGELSQLIRDELSDGDGDWIFEHAPGIERRVLELHRLWGGFREKLALRYVPVFAPALLVADDLAWACYRPAQRFVPAGGRREPPLVYFSDLATAHLVTRETTSADTSLEPLIEAVPIALVGLPWFTFEHARELPVVAHEVGHAVERDLALAEPIETRLVGAVPEARAPAWASWRQEVFADLYGVLALGPAYGATLAALLAASRRDVEGEFRPKDRWGVYPTRTLRILVVAAALRRRGFDEAARALETGWRAIYRTHNHPEFETDVEPVIGALLDGGFDALGGEPLTAILAFGADEQVDAQLVADRLAAGLAPSNAERIDSLVAGARLAYEQPGHRYDECRASKAVRSRAALIQTFGRRSSRGAPDAPLPAEREARDQAAGRTLYALMTEPEEHPDVQAKQP